MILIFFCCSFAVNNWQRKNRKRISISSIISLGLILTLPRSQDTQAHFAIRIQVRIKSNTTIIGRDATRLTLSEYVHLNFRRLPRIVVWIEHVEVEKTVSVRSIRRTNDQGLNMCYILFVGCNVADTV